MSGFKFQDGGRRHRGFSKFQIFNRLTKGSNCIIMSNFVKITRSAAEIWQFFDFPTWQPQSSGIFEISNFQLLDVSRVSNCVILPNFIEIARTTAEIWRFFYFWRWRPISDLWNFKFLEVGTVHKVELHHCAKFRRNQTVAEIWRFIDFSRRKLPQCWICEI